MYIYIYIHNKVVLDRMQSIIKCVYCIHYIY